MSLLEKRRIYEAMCQSKSIETTPPKPAKEKLSPAAELMRANFGERDRNSFDESSEPKRKLVNITEQKVLKVGLQQMHADIVVAQDYNILALPKRPDGRDKVMQKAFYERLLSNRIEIKGSLESDISAAQMDLRHLNVEQLLSLRCETLDFATESDKFRAHNSFLNTLDVHLFEKITVRCCERYTGNPPLGVSSQALHATGLRIALTIGAAHTLANGWDTKAGQISGELETATSLPTIWVIQLDTTLWKGSEFAILNVDKFTLQVLQDTDFETATHAGGRLAVVRDYSSGSGPARMMHWDIHCLDPHAAGEDLPSSIARILAASANTSDRRFMSADDLEEAFRKVRSRGNTAGSDLSIQSVAPEIVDAPKEQSSGERPLACSDVPVVFDHPAAEVADGSEHGAGLLAHQRAAVLEGSSMEGSDVPVVVDRPTAEVADKSEEGAALLAHQRAVVLEGSSMQGFDVPVVIDHPTAGNADESEDGAALLAHQRVVVLEGSSMEERKLKSAESVAPESQHKSAKSHESSCFASCFSFALRPSR